MADAETPAAEVLAGEEPVAAAALAADQLVDGAAVPVERSIVGELDIAAGGHLNHRGKAKPGGIIEIELVGAQHDRPADALRGQIHAAIDVVPHQQHVIHGNVIPPRSTAAAIAIGTESQQMGE